MEPQKQAPPGPKGLFGLEGLWLRRDPLGFLTRLARRRGDVAGFRIGPQRAFLLNHPDLIRDTLLMSATDFHKGPTLRRAKRLLGEGLLTSSGEHHRRQRRLIQPAFHRHSIAAHAGMIVACGERLSARWRDGDSRDLLREMRRVALDVVGRALLGADMEREADAVGEDLSASVRLLTLFDARPSGLASLLRRLPFTGRRRFTELRARLDAVTYRIIEERRRDGADRGDLLSMLLAARDEEGGMTDEQVRDEVMTFIHAGHATTANALTWTWYLLARNPEAEARLHRELDEVLGGRAPSYEDIPRLPYAEMVLLEAMRLYPPAWVVVRHTLREFAAGEYTLPAGSLIMLSQYVTHRDPRFFPDPERFDPERWTPAARAGRPSHAYFPFGGGGRRCIGEGFALLEGVLLVATLARSWRMRLDSPRAVRPRPLITLTPEGGMPMRFERRGGHAPARAS